MAQVTRKLPWHRRLSLRWALVFTTLLCALAGFLLLALETAYRTRFARNLTLGRLGEAVNLPLCPDKGGCMSYDLNRAPSSYVENDMEMLRRLEASVRIVIGG